MKSLERSKHNFIAVSIQAAVSLSMAYLIIRYLF